MRPGQDLTSLTTRIPTGMQSVLQQVEPAIVAGAMAMFDTMATSIAAFYQRIKVAHVEVGSGLEILTSLPEEFNRMTVSNIADVHFAPTELNLRNLPDIGVAKEQIVVTGNTVIDALFIIRDKLAKSAAFRDTVEASQVVTWQ